MFAERCRGCPRATLARRRSGSHFSPWQLQEIPMLRIYGSGAAVVILMAALAPGALGKKATPAPAAPGAERTTAVPVETGRLRRTHGAWRSSEIVGAAIYTDHDERIGSV